MSEPSISTRLAAHAFFDGFPSRLIDLLVPGTESIQIESGDLLLRAGTPAKYFFLIERGHVSIEIHHPKRGPISLQTMGSGETVGWSWLVPPYSWEFDARASHLVQGLQLEAEWLRDRLEKNHDLCLHLFPKMIRMMASRLTATRFLLLDLYH